jgi:hypothetical protein
MGILYKLDFASGKSYIGITRSDSIERRMRVHKCCANVRDSQFAVHRAWRKHGEPSVTVLATASPEYLGMFEQRAIEVYGTYGSGGYNMTPGGEFNTSFCAETLAKLSQAAKGHKASAETRAKMSASGKRKGFTDAHRANIAIAKTGSKHTPETLAKLRERTCSVEQRGNISIAKWKQAHAVQRWSYGLAGTPMFNLR